MNGTTPAGAGAEATGLGGEVGTPKGTSPMRAGVARSFTENEAVIERGLATFVDVGRALLEIRDGRQYRAAGWSDFDAYCRERWGHGRDYADKIIAATRVVAELPTKVGNLSERQARELAPLRDDPEAMAEVMEEATAEAEATGEKVTAGRVREKVAERCARQLVGQVDDALRALHDGLPGLVKIAGQTDLPMSQRECAAALAWSALDFFDRLPSDPEGACAVLAGTTRRVSEVLR